VVAGAVLLLVLLSLGVFVLVRGADSAPGRNPSSGGQAASALKEAAAELSVSAAVRYRGTITGPLGGRLPAELSVTGKGSALGRLTVAGEEVELMAVDGKTYFRADEDFWRSNGAPLDSVEEYAAHWVRVPPERLGIDVRVLLSPGELGRRLTEAATAGSVPPGAPATVNGVPATVVRVPGWTVYVSASGPRRILRVECSPAAAPPGGGSRSGLFGGEFELDLSDLPEPEVDRLYDRLRDRVRRLKDSVDSRVRFTLDGRVVLSPCDTSGCTARVSLRNSVSSRDPSVRADRPVNAVITIDMTLDGRHVRTCTETRSMPPNGSTTATCRATYRIPPSTRPRTHTVRARARAVARTVVAADIDRILADLKRERETRGP